MGFVESNLLAGEQVEYRARLHWSVYAPAILLAAFALVFFAVSYAQELPAFLWVGGFFIFVAAIAAIAGRIKRGSSEFVVTNLRVLIKIGLFGRHTLELLLGKIEGIGVDQTLPGRLFDYGSIIVTGTGGTTERFDGIAEPLEFRRHVQEHVNRTVSAPSQANLSAAVGPFCTSCGTRNPQGAGFCSKCGSPLIASATA